MRNSLLGLFLVLSFSTAAFAGDEVNEDYTLTMDLDSDEVVVGGTFSITILFTNNGVPANGVQGGVCTENVDVTIDEVESTSMDQLDTTFTAATVNPDMDAADRNWNFGFLMNVISGATLEAGGTVHELWICTYIHDGETDDSTLTDCEDDAEGEVRFDYCDIGSPAVETAVIAAGDQNPIRELAVVCVFPPPDFLSYSLDDITITYLGDVGEGAGSSTITLDGGEAYEEEATSGFQCALGYDDSRFEATGMTAIGELADMNDGAGPGFLGVNLTPVNGPGVTVGIVYNLGAGTESITFDSGKDVLTVDWILIPSANTGVEGEADFEIEWREDLGDPLLPNSVVANGLPIPVSELGAGIVTISLYEPPLFLRGDCNVDGIVNLADAIWILQELNLTGTISTCLTACDVNDDDFYDNSDAIYTLNFRFLNGPEPVDPYPDCGYEDEESEVLGCESQETCE